MLGHCNKEDIIKVDKVVDEMKVSDKNDFVCEPCILGKQHRTVNRQPSMRATRPLEFVSTGVCGLIDTISTEGLKYFISFVDTFSD